MLHDYGALCVCCWFGLVCHGGGASVIGCVSTLLFILGNTFALIVL